MIGFSIQESDGRANRYNMCGGSFIFLASSFTASFFVHIVFISLNIADIV